MEELKRLKDEADFFAPESGERGIGEGGGRLSVDQDFAGGWEIHGSTEVEKRGFAAAAAADKGDELAGFDGEGDVFESGDGGAFAGIEFGDSAGFKNGHAMRLTAPIGCLHPALLFPGYMIKLTLAYARPAFERKSNAWRLSK